jgi:hypothetical protein
MILPCMITGKPCSHCRGDIPPIHGVQYSWCELKDDKVTKTSVCPMKFDPDTELDG